MTQTLGWEQADLQDLATDEMDVQRLESLISALEKSQNEAISPRDTQKLQQLKQYFMHQLKQRSGRR